MVRERGKRLLNHGRRLPEEVRQRPRGEEPLPQDILKIGQGDLFNLLLDLISKMEKDGYAGSCTQSVVKAVKSWLQFNRIVLVGRTRTRI